MIQPSRMVPFVPSNAPPIGVEAASRVLEAHSVNRQPAPYAYAALDINYPVAGQLQRAYPTSAGQRSFPEHKRSSTVPHPSHSHIHDDELTPQERLHINHDAKLLYQCFLDSEQYSKYRQKQPKDSKGRAEQKWSDKLEEAFFYALVRWQPMGRRKLMWKGKPRGRNELIADYIQCKTGIARDRKQVSSHIQVLKPFAKNDSYIMRYLSITEADEPRRGGGGTRRLGTPSYTNGRQRSQYRGPGSTIGSCIGSGRRANEAVPSYSNPGAFIPVEFEMFVQRKHALHEKEIIDRLHTYTKQISDPMGPDYQVTDMNTFSQEYPILAHTNLRRPQTHQIITAEASLAMSMAPMGSMVGAELGISFRCRSDCFRPTTQQPRVQVRCLSHFYEGETKVVLEGDSHSKSEVNFSQVSPGVYEAWVNFGSNFWAKALSSSFKNAKESGAAYLDSITAIQEIFAVTQGHEPEHILTIHWSFRQSSAACGRASWRRLILPQPVNEYETPTKTEPGFDFNDMNGPLPTLNIFTAPPQPTLQPPFEYESQSASTLSSSTWPAGLSDVSTGSRLGINSMDGSTYDNDADFLGGLISFAFDPNIPLVGFDTSMFNFDDAEEDFVADAALDQYSQQAWAEGYGYEYATQQSYGDTQQSFGEVSQGFGDPQQSFATDETFHAGLADDSQENGYAHHNVYDPRIYAEGQAYGGAGPEMRKDVSSGCALAAMVDEMDGIQGLGIAQCQI